MNLILSIIGLQPVKTYGTQLVGVFNGSLEPYSEGRSGKKLTAVNKADTIEDLHLLEFFKPLPKSFKYNIHRSFISIS